MSPRPRDTTDEQILGATYRVVSRLGPNLTLADVAKEAGVSPATLDAAVRLEARPAARLRVDRSRRHAAKNSPASALKHRSAVASVYAVADCMAAMAVTPETLSNSLAFLQMDLVDPEFHKHALAHSRGTIADITALLDEAVAAGELKPCDTRGSLAPSRRSLADRSCNGRSTATARRPPGCARTSIHSSSRVTAPAGTAANLTTGREEV